jgi:hypothetical protein
VYSWFGLCEWLVVFSNIAFHYWNLRCDFAHLSLVLADEVFDGKGQ